MKRVIVFLVLVILAYGSVLAQTTEFYPGSQYDSAVPTPKSVLGYEIGEYFTDHHQMEEWKSIFMRLQKPYLNE